MTGIYYDDVERGTKMRWDTVIGLEVHAQLKTKSKLFSGSNTQFGAEANSQVSFIDAGLPGVLPVLNQEAVYMAIQFGLAIHASINNHSYFERKNYFYPDLPKGYQISQFQCPIVSDGYLCIALPYGGNKKVIIQRAHLEEDAGKSVHDAHPNYTGIDLNRAGIPLLEIVTTPCLSSAEEAILYLKNLHQLLRFLGICDGNMQEGSFRCDVNISLKPEGSPTLGTRTELKNLNSFRFIEKAIAFEEKRHKDALENGIALRQETRLFCTETETTQVLRSKEQEQDYRYFPDPDLLPIVIEAKVLDSIRQNMPMLPSQIKENLEQEGQLNEEDIYFLLSAPAHWVFFNEVKNLCRLDEKKISNWLKGTYHAALKERGGDFENPPISAKVFADLLNCLQDNRISNNIAKQLFNQLVTDPKSNLEDLLKQDSFKEIEDDSLLVSLIQTLIKDHPKQVEEYRQGREKLWAFFVGQIMKQTKGQASAEKVNALLKEYLR